MWSKIDSVPRPTMCEMFCDCRKSCTLTASRMIEEMSVMTVEIRTAAPNRVCESFSSRMTGNTMPTECEAKSEAYSTLPASSSGQKCW